MLPPMKSVTRLNEEELLDVLSSLRNGNFTARMSGQYEGTAGQVAGTLNETMELLGEFTSAVLRLTEELGTTGRLGGQMFMEEQKGSWKAMIDAMNTMGANLTWQLRTAGQAAEANANGVDLRRVTEHRVQGELRQLCRHINSLADRVEGKEMSEIEFGH
jgi:osomolarity two-component system sensor histidine kinase NIK1